MTAYGSLSGVVKFPRKADGSPIRVYIAFDGRVFVDAEPVCEPDGKLVHRGGPAWPEHHHRLEGYGLADGLLRCRKCGLVSIDPHGKEIDA